MLKLFNADEFDLNGELFIMFPSYMSIEQSREMLEYEIEMAMDRMGISDEEPVISPFWIQMVHFFRTEKEMANLTNKEFKDLANKELSKRTKNKTNKRKTNEK